jgi:hypothetical protein
MEEQSEVKTIQVDFKCPKCDSGYLRPNGRCLLTHPPKFPHDCNNPNCDYSESFSDKQYPYIDYKTT